MVHVDENATAGIGHNVSAARLRIEVRLYNSLSRYGAPDGISRVVDVAPGTTIGDLVRRFKLPPSEIVLTLRNGRDVSPGAYQGGTINRNVVVDGGDVIAFSGPVPYSYGYGAPVV